MPIRSSELVAVTRAADRAVSAVRARDEAIRDARLGGWSMGAIAAAARISRQRVHQILQVR